MLVEQVEEHQPPIPHKVISTQKRKLQIKKKYRAVDTDLSVTSSRQDQQITIDQNPMK